MTPIKKKANTVPKNTGIPGFCKNTVPYRTGMKFLIPLGPGGDGEGLECGGVRGGGGRGGVGSSISSMASVLRQDYYMLDGGKISRCSLPVPVTLADRCGTHRSCDQYSYIRYEKIS